MRWVRSWSGKSERLEHVAETWGTIRPHPEGWAWTTSVSFGEHASGILPTKKEARDRVEAAANGEESLAEEEPDIVIEDNWP